MKIILISIIFCSFCIAQTNAPPGKYFFVIYFNQSMDTVSLKDKSNYTVFDQYMNEIPVLNIATMYYENGVCADSSIVLLVNAPNYKTTYTVRVDSVYNKQGILISDSKNSGWHYFDGYNPNEPQPYLIIK